MSKAIYDELKDTGDQLQEVLSSFTAEQINKVPFAGSWTPGQVAEHLLISASGALQTVNGETTIVDRDAAQHVPILKQIFLDFSTKMKSPDFVLPSDDPKDKEVLEDSLTKAMNGLVETGQSADLSATCTSFGLPTIGFLTRLEWLTFVNVHTTRHISQLKNIKQFMDQHKN
jgi:hypothetical protein